MINKTQQLPYDAVSVLRPIMLSADLQGTTSQSSLLNYGPSVHQPFSLHDGFLIFFFLYLVFKVTIYAEF